MHPFIAKKWSMVACSMVIMALCSCSYDNQFAQTKQAFEELGQNSSGVVLPKRDVKTAILNAHDDDELEDPAIQTTQNDASSDKSAEIIIKSGKSEKAVETPANTAKKANEKKGKAKRAPKPRKRK